MTKKKPLIALLLASSTLLSGCFHKPIDKRDPYENFNRPMFAFNMAMDHLLMRPIAHTYNFITPNFVQKGVKNAFDNLDEVTTIPNDLLQGKFLFMLSDIGRVLVNTTLGLGGLVDVAKHMGLRPHYESFGLTLAYWQGGKHYSPYLVLPFIGPGTFRSDYGMMVDVPVYPLFYIPNKYWYIDLGLRGLNLVNRRSELLPANRMIDTAFDPYVFVRSAYTQTMDKIVAENQTETIDSKQISNQNMITVQDFANAESSSAVAGAGETGGTAGQSKGITMKKAEENGFIFDTDEKVETPAKETETPAKEAVTTTKEEATKAEATSTNKVEAEQITSKKEAKIKEVTQ
jgi:phospholipid-binding lipoprotein MlaA